MVESLSLSEGKSERRGAFKDSKYFLAAQTRTRRCFGPGSARLRRLRNVGEVVVVKKGIGVKKRC